MIEAVRIGEADGDEGLFGVLDLGEHGRVFTIERPWADNEPCVSCIPEGEYRLEPHSSPNHQATWALVGGTVSHYPADGYRRTAILFDQANWASELQGCIALGTHLGFLSGRLAVMDSAGAMHRLRRKMKIEPDHRLVIRRRIR
jgi:hypothetical protein